MSKTSTDTVAVTFANSIQGDRAGAKPRAGVMKKKLPKSETDILLDETCAKMRRLLLEEPEAALFFVHVLDAYRHARPILPTHVPPQVVSRPVLRLVYPDGGAA